MSCYCKKKKSDCVKCKRGCRGKTGSNGMVGLAGPIGANGITGPAGTVSDILCVCGSGVTGFMVGQTGSELNTNNYIYTQTGNYFELNGTININPTNNFVYINNNIDDDDNGNTVSGYSADSIGNLTSLTGSPYSTNDPGTGGDFNSMVNQTIIVGDYLCAVNTQTISNIKISVSVFSIDPNTGILTLVTGSPFAIDGYVYDTTSITSTPDGRFIYVMSNTITIFSVDSHTGFLTQVGLPFLNPGQFSFIMSQIRVTPDGKYLLIALTDVNQLALCQIDQATGELTTINIVNCTNTNIGGEGYGIMSLDITCDGEFIYAGIDVSIGISIDSYIIGSTGSLEFNSSYINGNTSPQNSDCVTLSPNNKFLFVSNSESNTITTLEVGVNGSLSFVSVTNTSTYNPALMVPNRDGTLLYVSNNSTDTSIDVFSIGSDGTLTLLRPTSIGPSNLIGLSTYASISPTDYLLNEWTSIIIDSPFNVPDGFAINSDCTFGTWNVCARPTCNQNSGFGFTYNGNAYLEYADGQFTLFIRNNFGPEVNNATVFDPLSFRINGLIA